MQISISSSLLLLLLPLSSIAVDLGPCDQSQQCGFLCCASSEICAYTALCLPIPAISSALAALPTATLPPNIIASAVRAAQTDSAALVSLVEKYQPSVKAPGTVVGLDGKPIVMPTGTDVPDDAKDGGAVFSIAIPTAKTSAGASSGASAEPTSTATRTTAATPIQSPTDVAGSGASAMKMSLGNGLAAMALGGLVVVAGLL